MWHKNCAVCLFLIMTIALALLLHAREQVTLTTSDGLKVYADFYPASSSGSNPAAIRAPFIAPIELLNRDTQLKHSSIKPYPYCTPAASSTKDERRQRPSALRPVDQSGTLVRHPIFNIEFHNDPMSPRMP